MQSHNADDMTLWTLLEYGHIFCYFVQRPGVYTQQELMQWKSLEAYNYFQSVSFKPREKLVNPCKPTCDKMLVANLCRLPSLPSHCSSPLGAPPLSARGNLKNRSPSFFSMYFLQPNTQQFFTISPVYTCAKLSPPESVAVVLPVIIYCLTFLHTSIVKLPINVM